ncbi:hypothetical protein TRIP_D300137 [uncultured Paludibacter sp.]|nr:hypothetical protein TRIP_D300137 [uncultured Paludibacter sp.]
MAIIDYKSYYDKFSSYDKTMVGKAVISITDTTVIGLGYPGLGKGVQYNESNIRAGFLTGFWTEKDGIYYSEIEFENFLGDESSGYYHFGYIIPQNFKTYTFSEKAAGKTMINELVENNKTIYENNLLCAGLIAKLDNKGVSVPQSYRKDLYNLQLRLEARNNKILSSVFLKVEGTGTPTGFDMYANELGSFMVNPKIGIAPIVIYIVLSVVITALLTGIIYLIFKPDYTDSKADLKVSKKLASALSHLSPEAKQEVLNDLESQVDKAYVEGKMSGSGLGTIKTIGYAAAGFLGISLLSNLSNNFKK